LFYLLNEALGKIYIRTTTDNSSVKNNYKTWYLTKNSGETIDAINID